MKRKFLNGMVLSVIVTLAAVLVFCSWLEGFSEDNRQRQRNALETALNRSVLLCYTLEGKYPDTLEEILEKYPLSYDRELFFVDYRLEGGNILPEITILEIK